MTQSKTKDSKVFILVILSISLLFSFTLWFSANAIIGQLIELWDLNQGDVALLSIILIIGFVTGGIISAVFNLPDIIKTKHFYCLNSLLGAIVNFLVAISPNFLWVIFFRFLTGFFLAGVYPTAMKLVASWYKTSRGVAIGILLGALTFGSGLPYLFNLTRLPDWRLILSFSSILALISVFLIHLFIEEGPHIAVGARFKLSNIKDGLSHKSVRLANYSYFGHMWELYAFWVWIPVFLQVVYSRSNPGEDSLIYFSIGTFLVFAFGAIANSIGGFISDKIGRTLFNMIMLSISGLSSLIIGFFLNDPILALLVAIIWGITVIPDSPQYSAMITELSDQEFVGTSLTIQTALGFAITNISIWLIPIYVNYVGWTYGFTILVVGPIIGIYSLIRLRSQPDSIKIALGKK